MEDQDKFQTPSSRSMVEVRECDKENKSKVMTPSVENVTQV